MPGRSSGPKALQYVGAAVALVAVVGYVALGWRFGETNDPIPLAIAGVAVVVAVGWEAYSRFVAGKR